MSSVGQKPSCHFYCNFPVTCVVAFNKCFQEEQRKERRKGRKEKGRSCVPEMISKIDTSDLDREMRDD